MELDFTHTVIPELFLIVCILFFGSYWTIKKRFSGFPVFHMVPKFLYKQLTGKYPKNAPLTSLIFHELVNLGKRCTKEGLFMMYTSRPVLFIFNDEATKFFYNEKAASDKSPDYHFIQDFMGKGINASDGERWRKHRKMINPAFHVGMLKGKVPLFNQHALAFVEDLKTSANKPSFDLLNTLKCHYFNALSESIFGLKQSDEHKAENLKFFQIVDTATGMLAQRMTYPWLHFKISMKIFPFGRMFCRTSKNYDTFVRNVVSDMKKLVTSDQMTDTDRFSNHMQKSFTYILLNHHLNDPTFTFDDVYDEVSTMLVTGYDTVTYTTSWCLFMLASHPEVQEKAFNEIQLITGSYVTYEETCNLPYLDAVILEVLRLFPTVPIIARNLSRDVQYGDYKVSKNTTIAFFLYFLHRNPEVFPDPEKFQPERFLNGESYRKWDYIPFSEGNRNCIGKKYGLIEMKIFLTHILRNYKLSSCDRLEDFDLCWNIVLIPARRLNIKITPRTLSITL